MDFFKYIHAVGTGVKGNRDLTLQESKEMMEAVLKQEVHSEQIAAFLLGWRLKPETTDEFRGVVEACDGFIKKTLVPNSLELGYPFDGKVNNPFIFPLVAKVLENSGLNLVVVGDDLAPAKAGITLKEVATRMDLSKNVHYFDRAHFFKEMHELTPLRMRLGLRTGLNTIEKLTHVASSEFAITGVFHKPYVKKYVEVFSDRYKQFGLIQGNEGTPELFSKGRLWLVRDGEVEEFIIEPERYGINYTKSWERITIEESLDQTNNPSDEFLKLARLNAAIHLFVAQKANSIDEAYEKLNG
ncbi:MAG: glycosyl transferase [Sulfurimonas sp.]|jgi:anthranilate phosphoribosyltransferase|uniref:anthranilate phosphoribosyltransferase n=1 Tax=unclassified Sulfurimonas TaxID=2623549 RepID=UPI0008B830EE|nr:MULTISPECIES: glycosyl transferase [unclassified Sulfurimonas]MBS4069533.1 glycosyl transferase [Sulfurimonas sp.]MDD3854569.1 glycosyl transferase [Sulfurimonas sp.]OHE03848.1 MAG: glycosyl transferase [Sulfurimonas sp. RIFOXYB12_FULL_35_9]OHE15107.1 MAG: glycosyl transferase [Sulfurimonas sp. RIFOXYD12_FULL_36_11]